MVCFNTRKHSNEAIYYNVNYLEDAIQNQKKVIYRYFDLKEYGEKVYRKDGHHYVAEPVVLVFNEDNYYLVAYSAKYDGTANYRVNRMDAVEVLDEPISEKALQLWDSISSCTEQAFKMYGGQPMDITIQFNNKLIGVVYDKFGEGTRMVRLTEDSCVATVKVQVSPTFWGWIFQFGGQMRITSPESMIAEYKQHVAKLDI